MQQFTVLTKYLTAFETDYFGEWRSRTETQLGDNKEIQLAFVDYSQLICQFEADVYRFQAENPVLELGNYQQILADNGITWSQKQMSEVAVEHLDALCVSAIIMVAVRAERFSEGALLDFFRNGSITKWLQRLETIDCELEEGSSNEI